MSENRGRKPARDYEDTISVSIPVPRELHTDLKVLCAKSGDTMKEVMYDILIDGVKKRLGIIG